MDPTAALQWLLAAVAAEVRGSGLIVLLDTDSERRNAINLATSSAIVSGEGTEGVAGGFESRFVADRVLRDWRHLQQCSGESRMINTSEWYIQQVETTHCLHIVLTVASKPPLDIRSFESSHLSHCRPVGSVQEVSPASCKNSR